MMEEIPDELVTKLVSQWMMAEKGFKLEGLDDKRQITLLFSGSLTGDFWLVQLVYEGTKNNQWS